MGPDVTSGKGVPVSSHTNDVTDYRQSRYHYAEQQDSQHHATPIISDASSNPGVPAGRPRGNSHPRAAMGTTWQKRRDGSEDSSDSRRFPKNWISNPRNRRHLRMYIFFLRISSSWLCGSLSSVWCEPASLGRRKQEDSPRSARRPRQGGIGRPEGSARVLSTPGIMVTCE